MVQGALSSTTRTCGKPSCPCHSDPARRHGPNLYFTWRADGRSSALYVPPEHADEAKAAQASWALFWETGCQIAALNREQLRQRWSRSKAAAGKLARPARRLA
jgi:hypothetical protein